MSVEAFTHQLYEPLVIPDDIEASLRDILRKDLHLHAEDAEHALNNPWDMFTRLSTLLIDRYEQSSPNKLDVRTAGNALSKVFTIGSEMSDAIQVGITKKSLPNGSSYPTGCYISLDMEHIDAMRQGGVVAIIEVTDDIARVQTIGNEYRRGQNNYTKKEIMPNDPAINQIYLEAYERLVAAIATTEKLPEVSDYIKNELGRISLFRRIAA